MRQPIAIPMRHYIPTIESLAADLRRQGATAIYLYGSVAKGTARPDSDADIFAVGPLEAQLSIDRRYGMERPIVMVDGVERHAHVVTAIISGQDISAEQFERMQPEAKRI